MAATRGDWQAWRRLEKSDDRWEQVQGLSLTDCTIGAAWHELQRRVFLTVSPDAEINQKWEYAVTRVGESPDAVTLPSRQTARNQSYLDRMMRAMPK